MNQPESHRPPNDDLWRNELLREWERQVFDDDGNFDLQLIAAYADGNVTDAERREVERVLARSPAALDLLVTLRQQSVGPDRKAADESTVAEKVEGSSRPAKDSVSTELRAARSSRRRLSGYAVASLIIAAVATGWAVNVSHRANKLSQEVAALDQRLQIQGQTLTLSQREQLLLTSSTDSPHFFAGPASLRLLEAALNDDGSQGRGHDTPEVRGMRQDALASARRSLSEWQKLNQSEDRPQLLVSQASLEIVAGALDAARTTISRLARVTGDDAPMVRNLRAGRLLALAETQSLSEGNRTRKNARAELEKLTKDHPRFADGWLNLALLLQRTVGKHDPAARSAWEGYLKAERVPDAFRATVRKHLRELDETE